VGGFKIFTDLYVQALYLTDIRQMQILDSETEMAITLHIPL
jgi:hypothetical protein